MKGTILDFSITENSGVVSGDDGNRYKFSGPDWKSGGTVPRPGARVDFVGADGNASEIYPDVAGAGGWTAAAPLPDGLDDRYRGLYCSSDDKMVFGLCGGLAHKFGVPVSTMRVVMFIAMFFLIGWLYIVGLFLPKVPTKGVPRPS